MLMFFLIPLKDSILNQIHKNMNHNCFKTSNYLFSIVALLLYKIYKIMLFCMYVCKLNTVLCKLISHLIDQIMV